MLAAVRAHAQICLECPAAALPFFRGLAYTQEDRESELSVTRLSPALRIAFTRAAAEIYARQMTQRARARA